MTGQCKRFLTKAILGAHVPLRLFVVLTMLVGMLGVFVPGVGASSVTSAVFSGGAGTVSVGGTLYAKQGAALTLTVVTSSDTKCVAVTGAATLPRQTSATAKSNWTFTTTATAGDGAQAFTVAASPNFNANNCTGQTNSTQASYTLDNTGPVVAAALTPAANAAGWNNTDVNVKWTATDAGSGVAAAQPFKTENVTSNGIVTLTAPAQSDRLGNTGAAGSVTVRVDKAKPTITATQTKNADGTTTITFTCTDSNSGGGDASGIATCLADGSTTNSKTVQPGVTVTGTATDKAGNTATASSTAPAGDTTAPTLSGAPTTPPNSDGWYKDNVTIHWTCSDNAGGSGIAAGACPADETIGGEGAGKTVTRSVSDIAGNTTTATSSPAVRIDRIAPTTGISGTSNDWVNGTVTVTLVPSDNLSGIASTSYSVDGGGAQTGTSFTLSTEGEHTVTFFSTDKAGNAEAAQTAQVRIDKTAPTIGHTFTPLSYQDGAWTNQDVTVTFSCADQGGSGLAGCTPAVAVSTEGEGQQVKGTASDNAGNSASDTAVVSIDKTAPTLTAKASGPKVAAGWYQGDVTVEFTAEDALSGVASTSEDKILGEGTNQSASGTAIDAAGNSVSVTIDGINVDKTKPVLSASFPTDWQTGDVTVIWSCTDAISGVATGPANDTITGEGANLSSTASCTDVAGNTATETVAGIMIDRTAPTTTASVPAVPASGWYTGAVQVTLTGHDNLSGVAATYYTVNGGAKQTYGNGISLADDGTHTITFWSEDKAGNAEKAGAPLTLQIDQTKPTTKVINPISPDSGWFVTSGIPFAFEAKDGGSGVAATYFAIDGGAAQTYGKPFTADLSDGTHTITYWSVDLAGNEEARGTTNTIAVSVDTTAPAITGAQSPVKNAFGWNNTDVDVKFTCTDVTPGSGVQTGVAGCAGDTTLANEGEGQTTPGDAVDVAGNRSHIDFGPVNIDKTAPSLTGAATTSPNAFGWYKGDVTIAWTGQDGLSGIDPATQPGNSTVIGEGSNQGTGPVSIKDKAGNAGSGAVSGIKIDRTAPSIGGKTVNDDGTPRAANAGWFNSSVRVRFACTDILSGIQECAGEAVLSTDGANQSATGTATDKADNSASATVSGINIDSQKPATTPTIDCTQKNGYCRGNSATVKLSAVDQSGLSGVKEIRYTVNGGAEVSVPGASATVSVRLAGNGEATVRFYAVDNAGNREDTGAAAIKYDTIAPDLSYTLTPPANAAGWSRADVTLHFDATDPSDAGVAGSGVDATTWVNRDTTVSAETPGRNITASVEDNAGNPGSLTATVKLDKTAPTISATVKGTKNAAGWYNGPVTIEFTCDDALSGIATCPAAVTLSTDGASQSVTGTAVDRAGNEKSVTIGDINIDSTKPAIAVNGIANGSIYTLGAVPVASCTATDALSDLAAPCAVTVTGGTANGVGTFNYTATATDKAGNTTTVTGSYKVTYRWNGFLQPINDTAHQIDQGVSIFKGGSTVPAKFQLKDASGTVIQAASLPQWLAPVKGSTTMATVDESVYTNPATSGNTYRWDATAQQYIYNWSTKGSSVGFYYRIGVKLDDGQTYYVNIGLR